MERWICMWKNLFFASACSAVCSLAVAAESPAVSWKFPEAAKQWNVLRNATVDETDDAINLISTKFDRSIGITKLSLDPANLNTLRIVYRAEGFKVKKTTGQLFFGTANSPKLANNQRFNLPGLILDGKKQIMTVQLDKQPQYKQWVNAGKITQLRLDIADQHPGDVYIEKIELLARGGNAETLSWDFADGIGDWNQYEKLKMSFQDKALKLETTAKDSRIINKKCRFGGKLYSKMRVVYRAEGFPGNRTTGQLFFTGSINKNYAYKLRTVLPSLICDGKTHEFTVKVPWGDEQITSLRLDIVDQFPGTVWIEKIELLKK